MAVTFASICATQSESGSGVGWSTRNGVEVLSDGLAATVSLASGQTSAVLNCYGCDFASMPSGAIIRGIQLYLVVNRTGTAFARNLLQLRGPGGDMIGTNRASELPAFPDAYTAYTIGEADSLEAWGPEVEALSVNDIKNSNFGFGIRMTQAGFPQNPSYNRIDYVEIRVTYEVMAVIHKRGSVCSRVRNDGIVGFGVPRVVNA